MTRSAWPGGRSLALLALAALSRDCGAAYSCRDAFGHVYVMARTFDTLADVQCEWIAEASAPPDRPASAAADPRRPTTTRSPTGGLVLAPAMRGKPRRVDFDPLIEAAARLSGQDPDLLRAIVQVESNYDPDAVSVRGAIGLMQIMPETALRFGLARPREALFEPESNLRVGALYLRQLSMQFRGELALVIAAYNAGEGAVLRSGGAIPPYPETRAYVRDVLAAYDELQSSR